MKIITNYTAKKIPKEKQTEKISVVVPVYNIEVYLPRAIESILNQTYQNLEVILVDDGSTDGSSEICEQYAKQDSRIKVLHKKNGGAGSARNRGMELASGEYLTFVDGDDWIEKEMYEVLVSAMRETQADMAVCRIQRGFVSPAVDGTFRIPQMAGVFYGMELLENYIMCDAGWTDGRFLIEHGAVNKLCLRSLAKDLMFSADICGEEFSFTPRLLARVRKGIYLNTAYYHYMQERTDSLMQTKFPPDYLYRVIGIWKERSAFLREIKRADLAETSDFYLYDHLLDSYLHPGEIPPAEAYELRCGIEKVIRENRQQIKKLYALPVVKRKRKLRMNIFLWSPGLCILFSHRLSAFRKYRRQELDVYGQD